MPRLTDTLEQLERDLAKYPGTTADDFLNRRLAFRKAVYAYGRECYGEGHHDGLRDALDAKYRAREAAGDGEEG